MDLEHQVAPEDLARSLIREFFLKQGYKSSLEAFEREDSRPRVKMTKLDLIKLLSMERLIKNNKVKAQPQQTMLEILTDYLFSKYKGRQPGYVSGDMTNTNIDDGQSVYSQNVRNQEFPQESVYGSQTNIQNKILNVPPHNHHRPLSDNNYSNSNSAASSNISNGGNVGVNSFLNSKVSGVSSGLNSQLSSGSQSHSTNASWMTQNSQSHHQAHSLDQQKPPKSQGQVTTNAYVSSGFSQQTQNNNKYAPQLRNPLQDKGSDYLSVLEEQNKKNTTNLNNNSSNNISTPQYTNNNDTNKSINSTSPFTDHKTALTANTYNNSNDDGEFKFESRRGNMKKVTRQQSNDKRAQQQQSDQVSQIRTSMTGLTDTNVASTVTTSKNQNSEFFANFDEALNSGGNQNNKLDFNDPIFGEVSNESRLITKVPYNNASENNEFQRPVSRQNRQQQPEINNQQNATAKAPQKEEEGASKQFNFFNKKKRQEDTNVQQQPSNASKHQDLLKEVDDFDQMLGAVSGNTGSRQFENPESKKKKGIFDDDDDIDFSSNAKSKQRGGFQDSSQQKERTQAASNFSDSEHAKINFFEPGIVNFDFTPPKINFQKTAGIQTFSKKNIQSLNGSDIQEIKKLLFSQSQNKFLPTSWSQGFILNENDDTFYGLFQKEGGPCGVIACVQAFYLKYLFYVYPTTSKTAGRDLSDFKNKTIRENCLVAGLAEILYNARGDDGMIRLAVIQNSSAGNSASQSVPIESCGYIQIKVSSIEQAYEALHPNKTDYIGQFNQGVTTFLYSVILTKGVKNIQSEMDSAESALIGHHGHCSQEQVNLFLTGKARSNCFDGEKVLDGDYKLKGIDQRSQFGFLTIFEYLKYIEVGSYLKTPYFPIWIICKEYHYSVIFAKDFRGNERQQQPHFDLVYYDELYNPEDRIILTVTQKKHAKSSYVSSTSSSQQHFLFSKKNDEDEDMIPAIEKVMHTKWSKDINVDWNGTQPIL